MYDTHVAFTAEQALKLRRLARERGESLSAVVRDAVSVYLGLAGAPQEPAQAVESTSAHVPPLVATKRPSARATRHPWGAPAVKPRELAVRGKAAR